MAPIQTLQKSLVYRKPEHKVMTQSSIDIVLGLYLRNNGSLSLEIQLSILSIHSISLIVLVMILGFGRCVIEKVTVLYGILVMTVKFSFPNRESNMLYFERATINDCSNDYRANSYIYHRH